MISISRVVVTIYSGVFVVDGQMPVPNWGFDNNARFRLCSSEVCNETRNILTENINSSIGACDDFYVHVCNGWRKNIPAEKQSRLRNRLRVLEIKAMRQLKGFFNRYKICMKIYIKINIKIIVRFFPDFF